MEPWFRLVTVHPVLTHLTIGAVPIFVLAYALAAWRRSERWTFVGDAVAVFAAVITPATAAFGLASHALVDWPGAISRWRWLHLGAGVLSTCLLVALAAVRLLGRRRAPGAPSGWRTAAAAAGLGAVVGLTGYVGGEMLVFRAGVGVTASGGGALAPPMPFTTREPWDVRSAMGRLRAAWASSLTAAAEMIVHGPSKARFATIVSESREAQRLARWLAAAADQDEARQEVAGRARDEEPAGFAPSRADQLAGFAESLLDQGGELERAGRARNLPAVLRALGDLSAICARCHDALRWP